ncbi:MAG: hypothetical protein A2Y91_03395 [Chloroflexi bacterium RBG_13_54_8]|nr:MAG: hypothetical protein A2Y91_03395 [Chloroflexi bacterium RBG_13_54_8]
MQTSNFRISGRNPKAVSIARGVPKLWHGKQCLKLAPSWGLISELNEGKYRRRYQEEVLDALNARAIIEELGSDIILLCWEAPGQFCHRRLVAEWIERETGIVVPEVLKQASFL